MALVQGACREQDEHDDEVRRVARWLEEQDVTAAVPVAVPVAPPAAITSLHCAVFREDQAAVERLLAAGLDPDEPDWVGSGDTPLMQAVTSGHLGIVRSLCAAGCSVDARRVNGQSALMLCVVSRATRRSPRLLLAMLEVLLAAGADPGVREKLRGQTALHALAKLVAASGAADPYLLTALRLLTAACEGGKAPEAERSGSAVDAQDHRRRTALHHLASRGCSQPEPYQILLEARADPSLQNSRGDTPLVDFLERDQEPQAGEEVVRLLVSGSSGSVVRQRTQYGESALHVAARRNKPAAVRVILGAGAEPASQDLSGNTALHLAAARGFTEVVSLLLAAPGCQVNAVNGDGYTALHVAVESGFVDVVNRLLGAEGVEVGQSVLEVARQEYRLRAQPQLAITLATEMDRRRSLRFSSGSGSATPPSSATTPRSATPPSCATPPSSATPPSCATPQMSPPRPSPRGPNSGGGVLEHPINYLGAQVSCTARIRPRYSASSDHLAEDCVIETYQQLDPWERQVHPEHRERQVHQVYQVHQVQGEMSSAVDTSLREATALIQKLCDEEQLSASPTTTSVPELKSKWATRRRRDLRTTTSDSDAANGDSGLTTMDPRGKFHLPANPYATMRVPPAAPAAPLGPGGEEDSSDFVVESLLAVAKSMTDSESPGAAEQFDRTGEIPKDYELFERSVLFGGAAADDRALAGALAAGR